MIETLAQIRGEMAAGYAAKFTAGVVLFDDVVVEAAPIVHYMKKGKWSRDRVRSYCADKGWEISVIHQIERSRP